MGKLVYRIRVGIHLIRVAIESRGDDRFWDAIGWWHTETHYTIPRLEEERRVADALEGAFTESIFTPITSNVSFKPSISFQDTNLLVSNNLFVIDPPGPSIGQWQWHKVAVRVGDQPNLIRRLLINVLTGAKWIPDNKKAQVSLGPEYDRLVEFISVK